MTVSVRNLLKLPLPHLRQVRTAFGLRRTQKAPPSRKLWAGPVRRYSENFMCDVPKSESEITVHDDCTVHDDTPVVLCERNATYCSGLHSERIH